MDPVLDVRDLSVEFRTARGRIKALRNVSFSVQPGRIVGIVGESGSGKSTVLWSILDLLAGNAIVTGGQISFEGRDMLTRTTQQMLALRGEDVSVVFQDPMTSQIPVLTYARQMRDILYRRSGLGKAQKRKMATEMLDKVGIPDPDMRVDQYPHNFSGGMRQRTGIAMAMLTGPKLLLADEPTTALDVTMEAQIIHLLREMQRETEATVVVVSHNLGLIAELCDEVVVMYAGEVVEAGNVHDIFHHARHPYTRALLECDPARIEEKSHRLPVIPGDIPDLVQPPQGCIFASRCQRVMPRCLTQPPPLVEDGQGGYARCHLLAGPGHDSSWPPPPEVLTVARGAAATAGAKTISSEPLLEIADLNVQFNTMGPVWAKVHGVKQPWVTAVVDASIKVHAGETVGLVGESGSGKTTLARAALNLVGSQGGSVQFEGQDVRGMAESAFKPFRRDMVMMFQDPVGSLSPRKSVRALITEPMKIHGIRNVDPDQEAERLADMVRLPKTLLSRYPHELSGGQARRVGVARALALNPKLVIADEPTAGLDVSVQGEILNLMADLQAEHGLGYLIITHNLPVVRHISDRLAIMYLGRIVEEGPADEVFAAPLHPYTETLVRGVPQPDPDRRRTHVVVKGEVPSLLNRPLGCDFVSRCPHARALCHKVVPPHVTAGDRRTHACHFPLDTVSTTEKEGSTI
ncbi:MULTISPECIES: ABC transporter ATP-binding protein [Roseobacteraceae]|uniref:Oligopeptide ABC transporter ATP-binding protein OppD n=1 Tax=Pseudosulfitobacter pseudonitzschiae TaxID=1402135 RepID=A0A221JW70_9RHOB|nr:MULTISPECIES: ABC transporter ATP-binding protein [Roseobacteraceae]ASM70985.1 oligopeptide ABC transporter ATP-binding protein OppD [Pseudosulfitobacter pseudonitzschiae]